MNLRRLLCALVVSGAVVVALSGPAHAQVSGPPAPPGPPATSPAPPAGPPSPPPAPPAAPTTTTTVPPPNPPPAPTVVPVPGGTITVTPTGPAAEAPAPEPEAPGEGTASLLRHPDLRSGQDPTLYEQYGTAGYGLDSDLGTFDIGDKVAHVATETLWAMTTWIADAAITIFQWSYSLDLFGMTSGAIDQVTAALSRVLYQPFVLPMVILAGLWLVWNALLKKRATTAAESSIWVVFALAAAVVFLAQPARIVGGLSGATTDLSRSILGGVATLDPKTGPADGVTVKASYGGDAADSELRAAADRMWRTYIYAPWTVLEFGTTEKAPRWGERLLAAKALTHDEAIQIKNGQKSAEQVSADKRAQYDAIRKEISQDPQAKAYFQGHRPGQRIAVAGLALAAVLLSGGLIAALALATLFAQLALVLLAMLGPVFLLAAIHPGVGRIIATRWANLLAYTAIKRVAYAVLLSVILVMNGALIDQGSKLGWAVAMTLSVALAGALLFYRKAFLSIIERVGTAGAGAAPGVTNSSDSGGRFGRRVAGAAAFGAGLGTTVLAAKGVQSLSRGFRRLTNLDAKSSIPTGARGDDVPQGSRSAGGTRGPSGTSSGGGAGRRGLVLPDPEPIQPPKPLWRPYHPSEPTGQRTRREDPTVTATTAHNKMKTRTPGRDKQRDGLPVKTMALAWGTGKLNPNVLKPHGDAVADHFATPPPDPDPER